MRWMWIGASVACLSLATGCQNLDPIEPGCGNRVIEPELGESCDGPLEGGFACWSPDEENACRLDCREGPCPADHRCGIDGVCRAASGTFTAEATLSANDAELAVGDLDLDGRDDLVLATTTELTLAFFDGDGRVEETTAIPADIQQPVIASLDDEEGLDLAVVSFAGNSEAVGFFGTRSRAFVPKPVATVDFGEGTLSDVEIGTTRAFGGTLDAAIFFDEDGIEAELVERDSAGFLTPEGVSFAPSLLAGWDSGAFDPGGNPCDELVAGLADTRDVYLLLPCLFGQTPQGGIELRANDVDTPGGVPPRVITTVNRLAPRALGASRVFLAQSPTDPLEGGLGILAVTQCDGSPCLEAAYRRTETIGADTFERLVASPTATPPFAPALLDQTSPVDPLRLVSLCEDGPPSLDNLLAATDLNGDGATDLVFRSGVFVNARFETAMGERVLVGTYCASGRWAVAEVLDANGDGRVDLAVGEVGEDDLGEPVDDFDVAILIGNGGGGFSRFEVPATGDLFGLRVGDFDGDTLDDVSFLRRRGSVLGEEAVEGLVAYGQADGGPSAPVSLGQFPPATKFVAGRLFGDDTAADVVAFAQNGSSIAAASLYGSASRQLIAPYELFVIGDLFDEFHSPLAMATATGPDGKSSVFALSLPEMSLGLGLWRLTPDASFSVQPVSLPTAFETIGDARIDVHELIAVDLDQDGIDELVALTDEGLGVARVTADGLEVVSEARFEVMPDLVYPIGLEFDEQSVTVNDLDGDGRPEIAFPVFRFPAEGAPSTELLIFFDQGLDLDPSAALAVPLVGLDEGIGYEDFQVAVAAIQADGDEAAELVIVQRERVSLLSLDDRIPQARPLPGVQGGFRVRTGDFDGDGVDDMVIERGEDVRLYLGRDRLESAGLLR